MAKFIPKKIPEGINTSKDHPLKNFLFLLIGCILLFAAIYLVTGHFAKTLAHMVPYRVETMIGQKLYGGYFELAQGEQEESETLEGLVHELWAPYDNNREIKLSVSTLSSSSENAFMAPGGLMGVTTELLEKVNNENELSFILCHEIGHFYHRHAIESQGRALALVLVMGLFFPNSDFAQKGLKFSELSYNRYQEKQADMFAVDCLEKKYGHVQGYDLFFEREQERSKENGKSILSSYSSTHPASEDRISYMEKYIIEKGYSLEGDIISATPYQ